MAVAVPMTPLDDVRPFYVPDFQLTLNGKPAVEPRHDVLSVTYHDSVNEVDSFELTVNNWDAERGRPKYDPPSDPKYAGVFRPGTEVVLELGYNGDLRVMTRGVITALEASWSDAAATLTVHGLNVLHSLRRIEHTHSWRDKTDSEIAKELGQTSHDDAKPGLGIEVRTSPRNEQTHEFVQMLNQHDIAFLVERARLNDYEVVLHEPDSTSAKPYITFGPSDVTTPVYRLEWGKTLVSFRYALDLSNQVGTMIVRGWNARTKEHLEGTAKWPEVIAGKDKQTRKDEETRMELLAPGFANRTHLEVDQPVRTPAEARSLARDLLRRRLKEMLQATGATAGLPDLRAGRKVEIVGFQQRTVSPLAPPGPAAPPAPPNLVEGEYFVTETTHTFGADGYRTEFKARREGKAQ